MTFNVYTANDAETGGTMTTAEGHRRQNTRFADIASWFDSVTGSDGDKFLKLKSDRSAVEYVNGVSADGVVNFSDVSNLAQGDILYYNGTNITRLGVGSTGQFLQTNGVSANPSWASVTGAATVSEIAPANGSTTDLSNNVRYVVDASAGSITLRLPATVADVTTAISVMCDGVNSFADNNFTLSGNGNNIIVKNADGSYEAAATSIDINTNADFNITKSGSNYILRGGII